MSYWGDENPGPKKGWHFSGWEMVLVVSCWFSLGFVVGTIVR